MSASGKKLKTKVQPENFTPQEFDAQIPIPIANLIFQYAFCQEWLLKHYGFSDTIYYGSTYKQNWKLKQFLFAGIDSTLNQILFLVENAGPLDFFESAIRQYVENLPNLAQKNFILDTTHTIDNMQGTLIQLLVSRLDRTIEADEGMAERFMKLVGELFPHRYKEILEQARFAAPVEEEKQKSEREITNLAALNQVFDAIKQNDEAITQEAIKTLKEMVKNSKLSLMNDQGCLTDNRYYLNLLHLIYSAFAVLAKRGEELPKASKHDKQDYGGWIGEKSDRFCFEIIGAVLQLDLPPRMKQILKRGLYRLLHESAIADRDMDVNDRHCRIFGLGTTSYYDNRTLTRGRISRKPELKVAEEFLALITNNYFSIQALSALNIELTIWQANSNASWIPSTFFQFPSSTLESMRMRSNLSPNNNNTMDINRDNSNNNSSSITNANNQTPDIGSKRKLDNSNNNNNQVTIKPKNPNLAAARKRQEFNTELMNYGRQLLAAVRADDFGSFSKLLEAVPHKKGETNLWINYIYNRSAENFEPGVIPLDSVICQLIIMQKWQWLDSVLQHIAQRFNISIESILNTIYLNVSPSELSLDNLESFHSHYSPSFDSLGLQLFNEAFAVVLNSPNIEANVKKLEWYFAKLDNDNIDLGKFTPLIPQFLLKVNASPVKDFLINRLYPQTHYSIDMRIRNFLTEYSKNSKDISLETFSADILQPLVYFLRPLSSVSNDLLAFFLMELSENNTAALVLTLKVFLGDPHLEKYLKSINYAAIAYQMLRLKDDQAIGVMKSLLARLDKIQQKSTRVCDIGFSYLFQYIAEEKPTALLKYFLHKVDVKDLCSNRSFIDKQDDPLMTTSTLAHFSDYFRAPLSEAYNEPSSIRPWLVPSGDIFEFLAQLVLYDATRFKKYADVFLSHPQLEMRYKYSDAVQIIQLASRHRQEFTNLQTRQRQEAASLNQQQQANAEKRRMNPLQPGVNQNSRSSTLQQSISDSALRLKNRYTGKKISDDKTINDEQNWRATIRNTFIKFAKQQYQEEINSTCESLSLEKRAKLVSDWEGLFHLSMYQEKFYTKEFSQDKPYFNSVEYLSCVAIALANTSYVDPLSKINTANALDYVWLATLGKEFYPTEKSCADIRNVLYRELSEVAKLYLSAPTTAVKISADIFCRIIKALDGTHPDIKLSTASSVANFSFINNNNSNVRSTTEVTSENSNNNTSSKRCGSAEVSSNSN